MLRQVNISVFAIINGSAIPYIAHSQDHKSRLRSQSTAGVDSLLSRAAFTDQPSLWLPPGSNITSRSACVKQNGSNSCQA